MIAEDNRRWTMGPEPAKDGRWGKESGSLTPIVHRPSSIVRWTDRLLFGALLLVLAMSPFEAGYRPLTRFFAARLTNLELALLALAVALLLRLAADPSARSRLARMPLLLPVLALALATVASWVFGEYRDMGSHYLYRLLMGAVVCLSAWEALWGMRRLLVAVGTLVAVGFVSATLGLLEFAPWFNIEPWLAAFKPMPTTVGGALRLSATFEYANGAAMYFEMLLPLALGLAVYAGVRDQGSGIRVRPRALIPDPRPLTPILACAVFMAALLLTLSRAALAGTVVALAFFGLVGLLRRGSFEGIYVGRAVLRSLVVAVVFMALGAAYIFATQPMFRLRLTSENDRNWYDATYQARERSESPPTLSAREWVTVPVTVRNDGPMIWRAQGALAVHLSYHWLSEDRRQIVFFNGERTVLPHDVGPGESVELQASLVAPPREGAYYLQWDLVQENVIWFSSKSGMGSEPVRHEVGPALADSPRRDRARTAGALSGMPPPLDIEAITNFDAVDRTKLWRAALAMFLAHPLTGVGPDGFRNLYGPYAGVTNWNRNIYTNNMYVEVFANLGLLGGLAFLGCAGLALWLALRRLLRGPLDARWAIHLGATAGLVAFLFHGFADYFLFSTPMYTVFWFLLAVGVRGMSDSGGRSGVSDFQQALTPDP